jgi:hypothetical protein
MSTQISYKIHFESKNLGCYLENKRDKSEKIHRSMIYFSDVLSQIKFYIKFLC